MRVKVKLKSTESHYFYTTTVNKAAKAIPGKAKANKPQGGKLKFRKYDPVVRKHVLFEEDKIK